jgi:CxxC motif-containing protein (DUF1111 family)
MRAAIGTVVGLGAALASACGGGGPEAAVRPGGDTTVDDRTSNAFSLPAPNLLPDELERHLDGDLAFDSTFVTGDAPVNGGLGPLFNNTSCGGCHNRDGRGRPQIGPGPASQALVRVSLPEGEPQDPGGPVPVPDVGLQLQDHAVFGVDPEVLVELTWVEEPGSYGDGAPYSLRRPAFGLTRPGGGELPAGTLASLRMPPAVFGLGLLEALDDATLEALADPDDDDGDGISGRINMPWDLEADDHRVGRFGLKANTSTLQIQAAAAYANDMGIANPVFPDADDHRDIDLETVDVAAFYTQTLGVPARAEMSDDAVYGEELFTALGCASCHVPTHTTGTHPVAALSGQTIQPFTDVLLHDMGDGLADGRPDYLADGREWRTPALWGLGLVETVLPGASFLHDGRARTIAEAILWHGGEAEPAREAFRTADAADRAALLAFLHAL